MIVRRLYGLSDAVDAWWRKLCKFIIVEVGISQAVIDHCLFLKHNEQSPSLLGAYVEDLLFVSGSDTRKLARRVAMHFPSRARTQLPFTFARYKMQSEGDALHLEQDEYARAIYNLPAESGFEAFRRLKLNLP